MGRRNPALALASTFARSQGWIDGDTVTRIVLGAIGLMVAWWHFRHDARFRAAPATAADAIH